MQDIGIENLDAGAVTVTADGGATVTLTLPNTQVIVLLLNHTQMQTTCRRSMGIDFSGSIRHHTADDRGGRHRRECR